MNSIRGRHLMVGLLLAVAVPGIPVRGEDPQPSTAASTNLAVTLSLTPPAAPAVPAADAVPVAPITPAAEPTAPSITEAIVAEASTSPKTEAPILSAEEIQTPGYTTDFGLGTPGGPIKEEDAEAQSRLRAPTPEEIIEQYGAVGFLIRQPEPRNFLEIINPFAPAEFGPREREVYNRDPNLKPGATLPRTFVNDITHEPSLSFWNWAW